MADPLFGAVKVQVFGRVQGVGFRYAARKRALDLKLTGWVRNEDDGSVSVYGEGPTAVLEEYTRWLESGPPGAFVSEIKKRYLTPQGTYRSFSIDF